MSDPTTPVPEATTPRWYQRAPASAWQRYAVALGALAVAIALTAWLHDVIVRTIFIFAFGAVTISAWYGGRWAGLLVGAGMFVFVTYRYYPPAGSFGLANPTDAISLVAFVLMATMLILLTDSLRRQKARAGEAALRATALAEQLRGQTEELMRQVDIAQDLSSELEESNAQLTEVNAQLMASEQRLRDVAARETELRRAAEAADRAKSDFLASMSHELRTPLNAIGGYVQLMELGLRGPLTAEQQRDLRRIARNQHHLLVLINDVLDFNRIAAGKLHVACQPVDVREVVEELTSLVSPQIEAKGLQYDVSLPDGPLVVSGDREKLLRILANLVSNAVKFTPARGRVWLEAERRGGRARLRVRDSGPGIPEDKLEVVFEPFVQLDRSLTNTIDGAGLGLTISRELARAMGGDVTVFSRAGAGAEFLVDLSLDGG